MWWQIAISCGIIATIGIPNKGGEVAMKVRLWQKRAALFLLVVYSLDLAWKLAHWNVFGAVPWWGIAGGLTIRFLVMGFILSYYLKLRKVPQETIPVTAGTKTASVRSMRIIHIVLLVAVVSYVFIAEKLPRHTPGAPAVMVESFSIMAALMVGGAFLLRRKLIPSAMEELRRNPSDETALSRWRMANILSMVLATSVALYGVALRVMDGNAQVVWAFFVASIALMLLWRPRLDEVADSTNASATPPN